jgi:hypothetical protein
MEQAPKVEGTSSGTSELSAGLCGFLRNARVVCNRCGHTLPETPRWAGAYSCNTCNSWTANFDRENGYDLRIDIADCTDWEVVSNANVCGLPLGKEDK